MARHIFQGSVEANESIKEPLHAFAQLAIPWMEFRLCSNLHKDVAELGG